MRLKEEKCKNTNMIRTKAEKNEKSAQMVLLSLCAVQEVGCLPVGSWAAASYSLSIKIEAHCQIPFVLYCFQAYQGLYQNRLTCRSSP